MAYVFSSKNISDFMDRTEYVEKISEYDKNLFKEYVKTKNAVVKKRSEMEVKVEEMMILQNELKEQRIALKKLKKSKKSEMNKLKGVISSSDNRVKAYKAQIEKQEAEIEAILEKKRQEIAKKEAANQAAAAQNRGPEYPEVDQYSQSAEGMRWPLKIKGKISSKFGPRKAPTAGASTYHKGIDISVSTGTEILAAADGTVVTSTYSSTAGNFVMIYHGNSLYTVYMHASKLSCKVGQKVKKGDVIAYVGNTGISTGAHLHFGISINGNYVNPLNYVTP